MAKTLGRFAGALLWAWMALQVILVLAAMLGGAVFFAYLILFVPVGPR